MIEVDYNEYKETIEKNMRLIPENHKLKIKIERLNKELIEEKEASQALANSNVMLANIITELEKWLEEQMNFYYSEYTIDEYNTYAYCYTKLQELKGVIKSEIFNSRNNGCF